MRWSSARIGGVMIRDGSRAVWVVHAAECRCGFAGAVDVLRDHEEFMWECPRCGVKHEGTEHDL